MAEKGIQWFIVIGLLWAFVVAGAYLSWRFTEGPRVALRRVLVAGPVLAAVFALLILLSNGRTRGSGIGWFWLILLASVVLIDVGHTLSWPSRRRRAGEPLLVFARRSDECHKPVGHVPADEQSDRGFGFG